MPADEHIKSFSKGLATDTSPDHKDAKDNPAVYWSVLHHKNVHEDLPINNYKEGGIKQQQQQQHAGYKSAIPKEVVKQPRYIKEVSRYGSTEDSSSRLVDTSSPPPLHTLHRSDTEQTKNSRWKRVREIVNENELLIRDLPSPEMGEKHKRWSDLSSSAYEITLKQAFQMFIALLTMGVIAFSFLFNHYSITDSLYMTIVLLTTVGYGDVTPTTPHGKIFCSVFALAGIVLLGLVLGVVGSQLVEAEIKFTNRLESKTQKAMERAFTGRSSHHKSNNNKINGQMSSFNSSSSLDSLNSLDSESDISSSQRSLHSTSQARQHHDEKCRELPGLSAFYNHLPGILPLVIGGWIMSILEKWKWYDTIYYCVVTSTTIGFGDLTPSSKLAKHVSLIFIPIAVGSMGYILGNVASSIIEHRRAEYTKKLWSSQIKLEDIEALDEANEGGLNELEYIKFMLVAMKKIDADLFDELRNQFKEIDMTGDGLITKRDLTIIASRRLRRVSHKLELADYKVRLFEI